MTGAVANSGTINWSGFTSNGDNIVSTVTGHITNTGTINYGIETGVGEYRKFKVTGDYTNSGTIVMDEAGTASHWTNLTIGGTLTNEATRTIQALDTNGGNAAMHITGNVTNAGTIDVQGYYLDLQLGGSKTFTNTGTLNIESGGTLTLNGYTGDGAYNGGIANMNAGTTFTGTGTLYHYYVTANYAESQTLTASTHSWTVANSTLNFASGTTLSIGSTASWSTSSFSGADNFTVTATGTANFTSGTSSISATNISNAGTINITGNSSTIVNMTGAVSNSGTINWSGFTSAGDHIVSTVTGSVINTGTIGYGVETGVGEYRKFKVTGDYTNSGTVKIDEGGTSSHWVYLITGGTFTNQSGATLEAIDTNGGNSAKAVIGNLTNAGTISTSAYSLDIQVGGSKTFTNTGTLSIDSGTTLRLNGYAGDGVYNNGIANINAGTTFTGTGTLEHYQLTANYNLSQTLTAADHIFKVDHSTVNFASGTSLSLSGASHTWSAATFAGADALTVGTGGTLKLSGNSSVSATNISVSGTLEFIQASTTAASLTGTLTNIGTVNFYGGIAGQTVVMTHNGSVVNNSGATLRIGAESTGTDTTGAYRTLDITTNFANYGNIVMDEQSASSYWTKLLVNGGTLANYAGSTFQTLDTNGGNGWRYVEAVHFSNQASMDLQANTQITTSGNLENSGTISLAFGKTYNFYSSGSSALNNQSTGTLHLDGTVNLGSASYIYNAGTITVGGDGTVGNVTVNGSNTTKIELHNLSGSVTKLDISNTGSHDTITVTGDAHVAGKIELNYVTGYSVSSGDTYTVISATNMTAGVVSGFSSNLGSDWFHTGAVSSNTFVITAYQGNQITGDTGDNTLSGTNGVIDIIYGSEGADTLSGGTGVDLFRYTGTTDSAFGGSTDTISDFNAQNEDIIQLQNVLTGTWDGTIIDTSTTSFSNTSNTQVGFNDSTDVLTIDTDGDGNAEMQITLTNVSSSDLDSTDIVFY